MTIHINCCIKQLSTKTDAALSVHPYRGSQNIISTPVGCVLPFWHPLPFCFEIPPTDCALRRQARRRCRERRAAVPPRVHSINVHDADSRCLYGACLFCRRRPRHRQSRTQICARPSNKPQREGKHPRPASRRPANLLKVVRFSTRPPDRPGHSSMQQHAMRMVHP